jgi:hypothetical protein
MMHTATPVGKDCVMGLASYSAAMKIFKWMVGTLRFSGYDGHIILGVHPQISQAEREYLIKHQVCEKHKACVYGVYVYDVYGVYVYDVYGESIAHHCALHTTALSALAHHCALHTTAHCTPCSFSLLQVTFYATDTTACDLPFATAHQGNVVRDKCSKYLPHMKLEWARYAMML